MDKQIIKEKQVLTDFGYMTELREIKLLKKTVKALAKMNLHYRIGKPTMPNWVFDNIKQAKDKYGDDLTKII